MSDVMHQCVPVSTGALSPDLRVNYLYGLVLGVDELEQEDLYFRERDERAARSLHGYGTATGLHVTAERPDTAPDDVEVRVEPGILVDQRGRPVVVRAAQCARVGAWMAAEEKQAAADELPSPLEAHLRPSGDLTLYVVAEYGSCLDALVPLPGAPCGSDDEVTGASRIRDSWQLGFRWEPPEMPHWDGVRALADLLLPIELRDDSPLTSDEELLAEHIRALVPGAPEPSTPLPAVPVLPRTGARAALDRLLTIWVTEVRPTLAPDLVQPSAAGEAAVLLSSVTVVPEGPFDPDAPAITDFWEPDDEGRPYLAPTQLVQELVLLGGGPTGDARPRIELASLTETGQGAGRQLLLWSHLPGPLVVPGTVPVSRNGGAPQEFNIATTADPHVLALSPPAGRIDDGERLEARLDLTGLQVQIDTNLFLPLLDWLQENGVDLLGRHGDEVRLRHTMSETPEPPPARPRPVRQLASARAVSVSEGSGPGIELWWHVEKQPDTDDERVAELPRSAVRVLAEFEHSATPVELPFEIVRVQHNVDWLVIDAGRSGQGVGSSVYVRVLVQLQRVELVEFGGNLVDWAEALGVVWEDAQVDGEVLVLWVRLDQPVVPPSGRGDPKGKGSAPRPKRTTS